MLEQVIGPYARGVRSHIDLLAFDQPALADEIVEDTLVAGGSIVIRTPFVDCSEHTLPIDEDSTARIAEGARVSGCRDPSQCG